MLILIVWFAPAGVLADDPSTSQLIEVVADESPVPGRPLPAAVNALDDERPLPINLASALQLAGARPATIEMATHALEVEAARRRKAGVLWLPTIYIGMDYQRNDGGFQTPEGAVPSVSRNQLLFGAGASAVFALTDAIYEPLAARLLVRARQFDVDAARNDSCFAVAEAYFAVQAARGKLAGAIDATGKAKLLEQSIRGLATGISAGMEVDRIKATRLALEQSAIAAREEWQLASAQLIRVLRLDATTVAMPVEPPEFRVALLAEDRPLDDLLAVGLSRRPELAGFKSQIAAAALRVQQERRRPLIPTLVVQGNSSPNQRLAGGFYGTGVNGSVDEWTSRSAWDAQVVWELRNLGLGNRASIDERRGQQRLATTEYCRLQEAISAEIVSARAKLQSAAARMVAAESGLESAAASFEGNARGMRETTRSGEMLRLVVRPQEAQSALLQLHAAYASFFVSVAEFNTAQYRLQRAIGSAAIGK